MTSVRTAHSVGYLDLLTLSQVMPFAELDEIHRNDIEQWPPVTPVYETVPSFYADVFKKHSHMLERVWKLSPQLEIMVEEERKALGWDLPGWDDRPREKPSDVVVGAHVRMGDKCAETNAMKAGPLRFAKALYGHKLNKSMHGENCSADGKLVLDDAHAQRYFDSATAIVNNVLAEHSGQGVPAEPNFDTASWGDSKPTLLVMSDETAVLKALRSHKGSQPFRLLHTVNSDVKGLQHGFQPGSFYKLSIEDRVKATQPMVRDMELISFKRGVGERTRRGLKILCNLTGATKLTGSTWEPSREGLLFKSLFWYLAIQSSVRLT